MDNDDAVGAAPTGDAPATSELSAILLPTQVQLISEVLWYIVFTVSTDSNANKPA